MKSSQQPSEVIEWINLITSWQASRPSLDRAVKIAPIKNTLKLVDVDLLKLTLKDVDYEKLNCSTHQVAFM